MTDDRREIQSRRSQSDRRDDPRTGHEAEVRLLRVADPHGGILTGELLDASVGGLRLRLAEFLAPEERLLVEVRSDDQLLFSVLVAVVWCQPEDEEAAGWKAGCGLDQQLRPRQLAVLQQLARQNGAIRRPAVTAQHEDR